MGELHDVAFGTHNPVGSPSTKSVEFLQLKHLEESKQVAHLAEQL